MQPPSARALGATFIARATSLGAIVATLALALPGRAHACSEPECQNGFLVPSGSASVPANAPGFWWRATRDGGEADDTPVHAWRLTEVHGVVDGIPDEPVNGLDPGESQGRDSEQGPGQGPRDQDQQDQPDQPDAPAGRVALDITQTPLRALETAPGVWSAPGVLLGVPLVAGQRLLIEAADTCAIGGRRPFTATIEVTPAQPVPVSLGTLEASAPTAGPLTVASGGGGCSRQTDTVYVDVGLTLSAEARPWADLLLYETLVDGARYAPSASSILTAPPHESWVGRGRDRLFVECSPSPHESAGLPPGEHEVQLVARLPGSDAAITSDVVRVALRCPEPTGPSPADTLYDAVSFQTGAVIVSAQLALLLYFFLTRSRRRRRS